MSKVKKVHSENKMVISEGYYKYVQHEEYVGKNLDDVVEELELMGWRWYPNDENRQGNVLFTRLWPGVEQDSSFMQIKSEPNDETQSFIVKEVEEAFWSD